jgi:hypothetical protein
MKLLEVLYGWIIGSKSDFTRPFRESETVLVQANKFWDKLDSLSLFILILFVIIGIMLASNYYGPFNNKPGRHYRPRYWFMFMLATMIMSFVLTIIVECILCPPRLGGALMLEFKIALGNSIYAIVTYFFTSIIWCKFLPTNACRILKI